MAIKTNLLGLFWRTTLLVGSNLQHWQRFQVSVIFTEFFIPNIFEFPICYSNLRSFLISSAKTIGDPTPEILAQKLGTEVYDIKIFSFKNQQGTNACSINNGGCQEICLFNGKYTSCACEYGELDPQDQKTCLESSAFLLFSRISRLGIRKKIIFNFSFLM